MTGASKPDVSTVELSLLTKMSLFTTLGPHTPH